MLINMNKMWSNAVHNVMTSNVSPLILQTLGMDFSVRPSQPYTVCIAYSCASPQNTWVIRWSVTVRSTPISHIRSQHYQSCTLTCHKYTVHKEKVKSKEWTRLSCVCCVQWKLFIIARDYDSLFFKINFFLKDFLLLLCQSVGKPANSERQTRLMYVQEANV